VSLEQNLRLHVYPVLGDRPMGAIQTRHVEDLIKRLKKTPVATNKQRHLRQGGAGDAVVTGTTQVAFATEWA
jgi:hypothetical protein